MWRGGGSGREKGSPGGYVQDGHSNPPKINSGGGRSDRWWPDKLPGREPTLDVPGSLGPWERAVSLGWARAQDDQGGWPGRGGSKGTGQDRRPHPLPHSPTPSPPTPTSHTPTRGCPTRTGPLLAQWWPMLRPLLGPVTPVCMSGARWSGDMRWVGWGWIRRWRPWEGMAQHQHSD